MTKTRPFSITNTYIDEFEIGDGRDQPTSFGLILSPTSPSVTAGLDLSDDFYEGEVIRVITEQD